MPWRFSFRALLIAVTLLTIGFAAMVSPWPLAATSVAFLGKLLLVVAVIAAFVLPKEAKPYWIGFAAMGFFYWSSLSANDLGNRNGGGVTSSWTSVRMYSGIAYAEEPVLYSAALPTTAALDWIQTKIHQRLSVGSAVSAQYSNGGYYPGVIDDEENGMYLIRWTDGSSSPAQWTAPAQIAQTGGNTNFRLAGHTIFAGLFGLGGGAIAIWLAAPQKKHESSAP